MRRLPDVSKARTVVAGVLCAVIGAVAGLLGIGGGELRLPILLSYLSVAVRVALGVNLAVGAITLTTSLIRRANAGALDDLGGWGLLLAVLIGGNLLGAILAVGFTTRTREARLRQAIRVYLFAIGGLLLYEAFFHFPHLDLARDAGGTLAAAFVCGLAIGWVGTVFGVAGGELRIPALIFIFGAPIKVAGTLSTIAALPGVLLAFSAYTAQRRLSSSAFVLIAVLGSGSVVGATVGVALLPSVPDSALRVLLATVLLVSAVRLGEPPGAEAQAGPAPQQPISVHP
jgi:uncharacterized membrane protein YfcA